jgi:hypothetical protein
MPQSAVDSEYDQALQAAMQHKERHCKPPKKPPTKKWVYSKEKSGGGLSLRRIRLKPTGAPQRNAFGSGSASWSYGGGEPIESEESLPAATAYPLSPSQGGGRAGDYERALAEAMRAGQMDAKSNKKGTSTNHTGRSFLKRFSRRSSGSRGGQPSRSGQWGSGSVSGYCDEQADEAARQQAERHEAYLRVLNKDKRLVSGTYTETGVQVPVPAAGVPARGDDRDESVADSGQDLIDFKFCEAVALTSTTSASSSPVSSCSRDTSISGVNSSFDLLSWDGAATGTESVVAQLQKGHALVNPFDVFAPSAP